jgi:hypothetical protein
MRDFGSMRENRVSRTRKKRISKIRTNIIPRNLILIKGISLTTADRSEP